MVVYSHRQRRYHDATFFEWRQYNDFNVTMLRGHCETKERSRLEKDQSASGPVCWTVQAKYWRKLKSAVWWATWY